MFIGHLPRAKQKLKIENEVYDISFDGFKNEKHNEDPFIWNDSFLYSFCHANHALSAEIRQRIKEEEVYLVFVAQMEKKPEIVEIDTIIKAEEIYEWPDKNERFKENLCRQIFNDKVVKYHLPNLLGDGTISEHDNEHLYTCVGNKESSFLPMEKYEDIFIPFQFENDDSKKLLDLIKIKNSNYNYVVTKFSPRLSNNETKKENFESISKIVIDLIKVEYENRNKLTDDKRFLKAEQICDLDSDYR